MHVCYMVMHVHLCFLYECDLYGVNLGLDFCMRVCVCTYLCVCVVVWIYVFMWLCTCLCV